MSGYWEKFKLSTVIVKENFLVLLCWSENFREYLFGENWNPAQKPKLMTSPMPPAHVKVGSARFCPTIRWKQVSEFSTRRGRVELHFGTKSDPDRPMCTPPKTVTIAWDSISSKMHHRIHIQITSYWNCDTSLNNIHTYTHRLYT